MSDTGGEQPMKDDPVADGIRREQTVTNDAVAGDTVLPGAEDDDTGAPGDPEHKIEPEYGPEDPVDPATIDLDTEHDDDR